MNLFGYMMEQNQEVIKLTIEHIQLTLIVACLTITSGILLGILATRSKPVETVVINFANIGQTIPTFAWFGLILPIMGIGFTPAIFALYLYGILPIIRNTFTGIKNVDKAIIEAGTGMGMKARQILTMVELPLALPVIMAGIRTSVVVSVGTAALAAFIGAGGLGGLVLRGIAMMDTPIIFAGAFPMAVLAILADFLLGKVERSLVPRGIRE